MTELENRLQALEQRNQRVEAEKAWETSLTRRVFIACVTYGIATLFLWMIGVDNVFLNAFVPTGGYILSTLSLPWVKQWWKKNIYSQASKGIED